MHRLRGERQRNLRGPNIARLLQDLAEREPIVAVRVTDRPATQRELARGDVIDRGDANLACLKGRGDGEGLEG